MSAPRRGGVDDPKTWDSINLKGTIVVNATTLDPGPSIRTRIGKVLKNWGKKIPAAAKKVGRWFKKVAKWAFELKATQWVFDKAGFVGRKAWKLAKGPIGWAVGGIAALVLAPKVVAVLLIALGVSVLALLILLILAYRSMRKDFTKEEWETYKDADYQSFDMKTEVIDGIKIVKTTWVTKDGTTKTVTKTVDRDGKVVVTSSTVKPDGEVKFKTRHQDEFLKDEKVQGNGSKAKLRLTMEDKAVTADETVAVRFHYLEDQLEVARKSSDVDLASEAFARMNLIEVRTDYDSQHKIPKDAKPQVIHGDFRKWCEEQYAHPFGQDQAGWNWGLMNEAAFDESRRFKVIVEMQEALEKTSS
jgi:hypothetical protein